MEQKGWKATKAVLYSISVSAVTGFSIQSTSNIKDKKKQWGKKLLFLSVSVNLKCINNEKQGDLDTYTIFFDFLLWMFCDSVNVDFLKIKTLKCIQLLDRSHIWLAISAAINRQQYQLGSLVVVF